MRLTRTENNKHNFLVDAEGAHPGKFEYFGDYEESYKLIWIKCKRHKYKFQARPVKHLSTKYGCCKKCKKEGRKKLGKSQMTTNEQFIARSKKRFGDRFDYPELVCGGLKSTVALFCNTQNHGRFTTTQHSHFHTFSGGCPECIKDNRKGLCTLKINDTKSNQNDKMLKVSENKQQDGTSNVSENTQPDEDNEISNVSEKIFILRNCTICNYRIKVNENEKNPLCRACAKLQSLINVDEHGILHVSQTMRDNMKLVEGEIVKRMPMSGLKRYYATTEGKIFNPKLKRIVGAKQGDYVNVELNLNGKRTLVGAHRLICETFNGKPTKNETDVDHKNRKRDDNRLENLRWSTKSANSQNRDPPLTSIYSKQWMKIREYYKTLNKSDEMLKYVENSKITGEFENKQYVISNYGRIWNIFSGKLLSPSVNEKGYLSIELAEKKVPITFFVHRLTCEQFVGVPLDYKMAVNHKNHIRHDNYYMNLEWLTREQNNQYSGESIVMLDDDNNEIKIFYSYVEASKYFKKSDTYFSQQRKKIVAGEKICGFRFKHVDMEKTMSENFHKTNDVKFGVNKGNTIDTIAKQNKMIETSNKIKRRLSELNFGKKLEEQIEEANYLFIDNIVEQVSTHGSLVDDDDDLSVDDIDELESIQDSPNDDDWSFGDDSSSIDDDLTIGDDSSSIDDDINALESIQDSPIDDDWSFGDDSSSIDDDLTIDNINDIGVIRNSLTDNELSIDDEPMIIHSSILNETYPKLLINRATNDKPTINSNKRYIASNPTQYKTNNNNSNVTPKFICSPLNNVNVRKNVIEIKNVSEKYANTLKSDKLKKQTSEQFKICCNMTTHNTDFKIVIENNHKLLELFKDNHKRLNREYELIKAQLT